MKCRKGASASTPASAVLPPAGVKPTRNRAGGEECFCANDYAPCMVCDDEDCREWYNTIIIHGETLAEAKEDIVKLRVAQAAMEAKPRLAHGLPRQ